MNYITQNLKSQETGGILNNIKKIRKQKGIKQEELAEALGVKKSFVSRIENDRKQLPLKRAIEIADYLDISLDELIGRKRRDHDE